MSRTIFRSTLRLLAATFAVAPGPRLDGFGVVPVITKNMELSEGSKLYTFYLPFSSAFIEAMKAIIMAFLSRASFSDVWIAVLSAVLHSPIV